MVKRLRQFAFFTLSFFAVMLCGVNAAFSQFYPGDVAFVGFNSDSNSDFALVVFTDVSSGQQIHFTNEEWNGSAFTGSGGDFTWVAPAGGITAGTILIFNDVGTTPSVNTGDVVDDANLDLSGSGDVLYAFTGIDKNTPDEFLAAITTDENRYNQPDGTEGTLANTGLTQGSTAILLSDNIDVAQYIGSRGGNTPNGYIALLNDIVSETSDEDNWEQFNGTGDQDGQVLPFNTQSFNIVDPPTVNFTVSASTVNENAGTTTLTVELAEADGEAVSVDVVFLSGSSTAAASDIGGYNTQTVSFSASDPSGTPKNVTVNITDDTDFEGDEKAVFQLQNNTAGSLISPRILTLTIEDDEQPAIVINEFLADPPDGTAGDANGDGSRSSDDDEFIEIVNTGSKDIDISEWKLSDDGTNIVYTFPSGSVLAADNAAVIFGGGEPTGFFGSAIVHATSSLSLSNSGNTITLLNANGDIVSQAVDDGSIDAQSATRDPDLTGDFEAHSTAANSGGALFSPGTKVDGTAFGSTYAVAFRGTEGWRMISSPTQSTTFEGLFSNLWMQGAAGSNDPSGQGTLFYWDESIPSFVQVTDMNAQLTAGKGYIVYTFADDEFTTPGLQGGFPKIINTPNTENISPVSVAVTSNDSDNSNAIDNNEGWNMLGNPYGTDVLVDAVLTALSNEGTVNTNVYIWNHSANSGNGDYIQLSQGSGETIAPFQAFWIRYTATIPNNSTANFNRADLAANQGTIFYDRKEPLSFEIRLGNGQRYDDYQVVFKEKGRVGEDRLDGYKLFSLNGNSINIYSTVGEDVRLAMNVLPPVREIDSEIRIPVYYQLPESGEYTFTWSDELPSEIEIYLIDNETGRKVDLKSGGQLSFTYQAEEKEMISRNRINEPVLSANVKEEKPPRFELVLKYIEPGPPDDEMEKPVTMSPPYPNPFNSQTAMTYKLKEPSRVTITIWNIVGQKVATLVDDVMKTKGEHEYYWTVDGNIPSGIYICKLEAAGTVIVRKMTYIK